MKEKRKESGKRKKNIIVVVVVAVVVFHLFSSSFSHSLFSRVFITIRIGMLGAAKMQLKSYFLLFCATYLCCSVILRKNAKLNARNKRKVE